MLAVLGRYRLLERLGEGRLAEVFKAKSFGVEGFEKVLVVKRVWPDLARNGAFIELFVQQSKLAARLSHANIVQLFDLGRAASEGDGADETGDSYYVAMEYVHGLDLAAILAECVRRGIALPIDMCAYVASEVAKALDHAHRRRDERMRPLGVVHRDVSPRNVILSFEGEVKVTDFGVAKALEALSQQAFESARRNARPSRFSAASPEQARGESVDARSDVFSLAATAYECLAGVSPFAAPTLAETLQRIEGCDYPPLAIHRPDAPPELVAAIETAMAERPADRYPDAGRLYDVLLAFLYKRGRSFGAADLAEFVSPFRTGDLGASSGSIPLPAAPHADANALRSDSDVSREESVS